MEQPPCTSALFLFKSLREQIQVLPLKFSKEENRSFQKLNERELNCAHVDHVLNSQSSVEIFHQKMDKEIFTDEKVRNH